MGGFEERGIGKEKCNILQIRSKIKLKYTLLYAVTFENFTENIWIFF